MNAIHGGSGIAARLGLRRSWRRTFRRAGLATSRGGFSLIEVIVAMLILTVGLLALASGTGWILRSTEGARVDTVRAAALQSAVEEVRGLTPAELNDGGTLTLPGGYTATFEAVGQTTNSVQVQIVLTGAGRVPQSGGNLPRIDAASADTLLYRVVR